MRLHSPPANLLREYQVIRLVLLLAFAHGLLYVFLMPPWQHYDEPGHFEYAWQMANRPDLLETHGFDQAMRREVAASMLEHNFFNGLNFTPNLLSPVEPVWIGISQVDDVPLYYFLASLPLRVLRGSDITFQLYIGRLVSLGLMLLTIAASYAALREITPAQHPLRVLIPLSLALLPGFIDLMTAVNNDAGAVAALTVFVWAGLVFIQRGFSIARTLALAAAVGACLLTKSTAAVALPLALFALLWGGVRSVYQLRKLQVSWAWGVFALSLFFIAVALASFGWSGARFWTSQNIFTGPSIVRSSLAPGLGEHAFRLVPDPAFPYLGLVQPLEPGAVASLAGQTVTLGAWIWSETLAGDAVLLRSIALEVDGRTYSSQVAAGPQPGFFALTIQLPDGLQRINIHLQPGAEANTAQAVFYDGIVLATGSRPAVEAPHFASERAEAGTWGGQPFTNLVKNPSAENARLRIRPWLTSLLTRLLSADPSLIFLSIDQPRLSFFYYRETVSSLMQTFWGRFGWGHIVMELRGVRPYYFLSAFTLVGIAASLAALSVSRRRVPRGAVIFLALTLALAWLLASFRGLHSLIGPIFIPSARYAYPAILPSLMVIYGGWYFLWRWVSSWVGKRYPSARRLTPMAGALFLGGFFLALNLTALWSVIRYYYR